LQDFTTRYNEAQQAARTPPPRSLALESARGRTPDPRVFAAVKETLAKAGETGALKPEEIKAAHEKLLAGFLKSKLSEGKDKDGKEKECKETYKDRPHFEFAWAAFDLAAGDDSPAADKIKFLAELLRAHQTQPQYLEGHLLRRLGELAADPDKTWRPEMVHLVLRTGQDCEIASAADPNVLPWVRALIDDA